MDISLSFNITSKSFPELPALFSASKAIPAVIAPSPIIAIARFLDLVLVYNPGISYGIFSNGGEIQRIFLIVLSVIIIAYLIYWIRSSTSKFLSFGLCLIIGGALGNMVDRIIYGKVVDFISLHVFDYYWYVFNIADIAIVSGGLSVLMVSTKDSFRNS